MAEPNDFGNSANPSATTKTVTTVLYYYPFESDLPAGATFEMKLTINGQSATKTLTVPAGKTARSVVVSVQGILI